MKYKYTDTSILSFHVYKITEWTYMCTFLLRTSSKRSPICCLHNIKEIYRLNLMCLSVKTLPDIHIYKDVNFT